MEELNFVNPHRLEAEPNLELNTTAYWLRQRFGVSPLFFHAQKNLKTWTANASLLRTEAGKRVALGGLFCFPDELDSHYLVSYLDGLYRFSSGHGAPVSFVWFSHSLLKGQSSTYIIDRCPEHAKALILSFAGQRSARLIRPLSIDAILFEHGIHVWGEEIFLPRQHLVTYVRF